MREPTQREVDEACMNYDHSFGLMSIADANKLRFSAREWLRAWQKVEDHGSPDEIEIYRAIKASGARKHADIARVVAKLVKQREGQGDGT